MRKVKTAWHHIRRSPYQAFSVIFIMAQTFFVISFFTFVLFGSAKVISYFESIPQVTAFFKNEASQKEIDVLQEEMKGSTYVAEVEFVSKEQGLKLYREQNKDDPLLLELVTADVLPAALKISTVKIDDLQMVADRLSSSSIVERVIIQKDVIKNLISWTSALRKIGAVIIAVLALDAIFIMVIVLSIRISQRRDEIEIMRLLGADNWYVRWPFLYEGMFYGVIGAFFGWFIASVSLLYATPLLTSFLKNIPILPVSPLFLLYLLGIEILLAIFLGAFASFVAVFRYLK